MTETKPVEHYIARLPKQLQENISDSDYLHIQRTINTLRKRWLHKRSDTHINFNSYAKKRVASDWIDHILLDDNLSVELFTATLNIISQVMVELMSEHDVAKNDRVQAALGSIRPTHTIGLNGVESFSYLSHDIQEAAQRHNVSSLEIRQALLAKHQEKENLS